MNAATYAAKNLLRNKMRTGLTILAIVITMLAFMGLRTVLDAWQAGADYAAKDRLGTRHKITFIMPLPLSYVDKLRQNKDANGQPLGVTDVTWANWFGAKNPNAEKDFFANMAVDPESFLRVYDEISLTPEEKQAWLSNRRGAIVGDLLAKNFGWKVGDKITLEGTIFPGNWDFVISGIYHATRKSADRNSFYFHWNYLNESLPEQRQDKVGWIASRITDPSKSAEISKKIDQLFAGYPDQTLTMSEHQLQISMMGMLTAVLTAINVVSLVILAIMLLILGNTIAMGARERTNEYGVLRAIGFMPRHLVMFILGEAATLGLIGGGLGVLAAYGIIDHGVGPALEANMGGFFPFFRVSPTTALMAIGLAMLLGIVAAAIPAYRSSRIEVVDAIRRVG